MWVSFREEPVILSDPCTNLKAIVTSKYNVRNIKTDGCYKQIQNIKFGICSAEEQSLK